MASERSFQPNFNVWFQIKTQVSKHQTDILWLQLCTKSSLFWQALSLTLIILCIPVEQGSDRISVLLDHDAKCLQQLHVCFRFSWILNNANVGWFQCLQVQSSLKSYAKHSNGMSQFLTWYHTHSLREVWPFFTIVLYSPGYPKQVYDILLSSVAHTSWRVRTIRYQCVLT